MAAFLFSPYHNPAPSQWNSFLNQNNELHSILRVRLVVAVAANHVRSALARIRRPRGHNAQASKAAAQASPHIGAIAR